MGASAVCLQMQRWNAMHSPSNPLSISVNLSGRQFTHSNLLEQITQILQVTGLDPRLLKLEITESVVMESVESAAVRLRSFVHSASSSASMILARLFLFKLFAQAADRYFEDRSLICQSNGRE
jgi:EAL domain-containing protein (putative c-di-GMP-specific phosphodiesterase class I)